MDDQPLEARLARRDRSALEDAYTQYGPSLLVYLRRYVGANEAEDVLQRTFLDAWRNAHRYQQNQRLSSWLFTIAHHRAVDTLRARRHQVINVEAARDLVGEDGRETAERFAEAADVRAAVAQLPDHERRTLELTYFAGMTQAEVARAMDTPIGTVKARASRGTRRLATLMRAQLQEGDSA
ncbi:MAG TPA: sigma-70 family RNA polymerase sigma factor [Nocardioides sp.]|nr:sigma-70 family RNA polymerase sigma factor [Nocardioides sp.]